MPSIDAERAGKRSVLRCPRVPFSWFPLRSPRKLPDLPWFEAERGRRPVPVEFDNEDVFKALLSAHHHFDLAQSIFL